MHEQNSKAKQKLPSRDTGVPENPQMHNILRASCSAGKWIALVVSTRTLQVAYARTLTLAACPKVLALQLPTPMRHIITLFQGMLNNCVKALSSGQVNLTMKRCATTNCGTELFSIFHLNAGLHMQCKNSMHGYSHCWMARSTLGHPVLTSIASTTWPGAELLPLKN